MFLNILKPSRSNEILWRGKWNKCASEHGVILCMSSVYRLPACDMCLVVKVRLPLITLLSALCGLFCASCEQFEKDIICCKNGQTKFKRYESVFVWTFITCCDWSDCDMRGWNRFVLDCSVLVALMIALYCPCLRGCSFSEGCEWRVIFEQTLACSPFLSLQFCI